MSSLEKFAAYPTSEQDVTADKLARISAVQAQASWSRIFPLLHAKNEAKGKPNAKDADDIHYLTMANAVAEYTVVHLLRTLQEHAPEKADEVARDIWGTWEDGGAVGEWVWEWLAGYGINPDEVSAAAKPDEVPA
jgi:hypothetical protein